MMFLKRQLPVIVAFLAGLVFWAQFYVPSKFSQDMLETFNSSWAIIMVGGAFILGVLSAVDHHWSKIAGRKSGYGYSMVALFVFGMMLLAGWFPVRPFNWGLVAGLICLLAGLVLVALGALSRTSGTADAKHRRVSGGLLLLSLGAVSLLLIQPLTSGQLLFWQVTPTFTGQTKDPGSLFMWFFDHCFVPLDATMFSLLAFYIASAAFRAFRARSFEATALLIAGCLVMIGRVPLGEQIVLIPKDALITLFNHYAPAVYSLLHVPLPDQTAVTAQMSDMNISAISSWILNNPNNAAQRGILLGVILSQIAIGLRIIFGIERTYMGGGE